jgi:hypothetical protein
MTRLETMLRQVPNLLVVKPGFWARSGNSEFGTEQDIVDAIAAEQIRRDNLAQPPSEGK